MLYLADEDAERLVPLPGGPGSDREPLRVDGTLPGRAYRLLQTQPAVTADGQARLWVPVVDGLERLGVLDVMTGDPQDLQDPHLRRQCWWLAHLLGHLVTAVDAYGDVVDRVRAARPRGASGTLAAALLPPPTAGTDDVVVAARVAPAPDCGGDLFDHALSATHAQVAVVDAPGSGLAAGLAAAVAVSAYRSARRGGAGVFEQLEAAHAAVVEHAHGPVAALAADLELATGRLRYLAAGHTAPLLLRQGRVVKHLQEGRRPALGQEVRSATVGEEHLQRGDTVVLYSDGVVDARDGAGRPFGVDRLADVLHRGTAERMPLPEVARRVTRAVLAHRDGELQDDATVLLVRWTGRRRGTLDPEPGSRRVSPAGAGPSAPTAA